MIQSERVFLHNSDKKAGGNGGNRDFVLYWMQQSHRSETNHALEWAVKEANRRELPLLVLFVLVADYQGAGRRHYRFMLQGIAELQEELEQRGIGFIVPCGDPVKEVSSLAGRAAVLVFDTGYSRIQRLWRKKIRQAVDSLCPVVEVESDLIIPFRTVSSKEEYSAATIRKKIQRNLFHYLVPLDRQDLRHSSVSLALEFQPAEKSALSLESLLSFPDPEVPPVTWMTGGYSQARARLESFIEDGRLERFHEERNDPARDGLSHLSPYLHYGQISALEIALEASRYPGPGTESFLEELIVRRELAFNFVAFNAHYDRFECLPNWAREDLEIHAADRRPYLYSPGDLEKAQTHDPYWNAAQKELVYRGKIHGYMRMYWGKKILEWSDTPRNAYTTAVYLNDRYSLDGRDPNGYAGVAWCFGKHDRPWAPRPVFGKVRYMNDRGLERKFDIKAYVERVNSLVAGALERE